MRKKAKEKIIRNYLEKDGNKVSYLNLGGSKSVENQNRLKQKLTTGSLFSENELIAVSLADKIDNAVTAYLSDIPVNITLLLEAPMKLPSSGPLIKSVKKLGGEIQLFEIAVAGNKEALRTAVRNFLIRNKIEIDAGLINRLIEQGRGDWWFVFTALEQAVLLIRSRVETHCNASLQKDIAELFNLPEEKNIFRLFDAIGNGNQAEAFSLLYANTDRDRKKADTDVETVLGFTSLMARQLRQMLAVKEGMSLPEAQKIFQVPGFAYEKLKRQVTGFDTTLLVNAYQKLVEIQEKAKSGLWSPLSLVDFYVIYLVSHRQAYPK